MASEKQENKEWIGVSALVALVICVAIYFFNYTQTHSPIDSVEKASERVVGTWTYTKPTTLSEFPYTWLKWVVKPKGQIVIYQAEPKEDNWGKPNERQYTVITEKYIDTGERYYALKIDGWGVIVYDESDDRLVLTSPNTEKVIFLERSDKYPFSK